MEKNKFNLPFSLGNVAGYNGCNIYDINSEYICGLVLPLHQTIQQIRKDAETDLRTAKGLELADYVDYVVNACNSYEKNQKIKLAAIKLVSEFERAIRTGDIFAKGLPAQMLLGDAIIFAKELQSAIKAGEGK